MPLDLGCLTRSDGTKYTLYDFATPLAAYLGGGNTAGANGAAAQVDTLEAVGFAGAEQVTINAQAVSDSISD